MKCPECGEAMKARTESRRGYAGLKDLTIDGVEVRHCDSCGETEVVYNNIEGMNQAIALGLAKKKPALVPEEIRFLRTYLGLSTEDLARRMGVTRDSVTRWERVADKPVSMGSTAERLLRLMAVHESPVSDYPLEQLDEVASTTAAPVRLRVHGGRKGWKPQAA